MLDDTSDSGENKLYIHDIRVQCAEEDENRPELDNLGLVAIKDGENIPVDLRRVSRTMWRRNRINSSEFPIGGAMRVVITSNVCEDIGHIEIDLNKCGNRDLVWDLESSMENTLTLSISVQICQTGPFENALGNMNEDSEENDSLTLRLSQALSKPENDPKKPGLLNKIGTQFYERFSKTESISDIDACIRAYEQALELLPIDENTWPLFLNDAARACYERGKRYSMISDVNKAITRWQLALTRISEHDHGFLNMQNDLGLALVFRFSQTGELSDISQAIQHQQQTVELTPEGHPDLPTRLNNLGTSFTSRFDQTGDLSDITQAITLHQQAVELTPAGHPELPLRLNSLGYSFLSSFDETEDPSDLAQAIQFRKQAVDVTPEKHPDLPTWLSNLGNLISSYCRSGDLSDLAEAIRFQQQAVALTPDGHPDLPTRLTELGISLTSHFDDTGDLHDLDRAIEVEQQALVLTPEEHPTFSGRLKNLGDSFLIRFDQTGDLSDLTQSIHLHQQALELTPERDRYLPSRLLSLGNSFSSRFAQTGNVSDLSRAIELKEQAVKLTPNGHPRLLVCLNNLGNSYSRRFDELGDLSDLAKSIHLHQQALELTSERHPALPAILSNLGLALATRFQHTGDLSDLAQAIQVQKQAVTLTPEEHLDLPLRLATLGISFRYRFDETGDLTDLAQAIEVEEQALKLTPEGHPHFPGRLNNLANTFSSSFDQTGNLADLVRSIELHQQAVEFTPAGRPELPARLQNLGNSFSSRFHQTDNISDLAQSIQLQQQAVKLTPEQHPALPNRLLNLGLSFYSRFQKEHEISDQLSAIANFRTSAMSTIGSLSTCLEAAREWALLSFDVSTSEVINAHDRIINLISLLAGMENTLRRRHEILKDSSELSTAAAAAALLVHQPSKALEWLEEGRCIVWNQINLLRQPVDDLHAHHPHLADQFILLSRQLEDMQARDDRKTAIDLPFHAQVSLETEVRNHLMLAKEREDLLGAIREMQGFESFLRPRKCTELMNVIPDKGIIVIINSDEDRCDALVLVGGRDEPIHVPLPKFTDERARTLADGLRKYLVSQNLRSRYTDDAASDSRALGKYKGPRAVDELKAMLRTLWTDLLNPILESLAMKNPSAGMDLPRIWWCPTGPFAFLPIHAAGIYDPAPGTPGVSVADYVVSSYIPNLRILERLRSRKTKGTGNGVLLVSQPNTPDLPPIPKTKEETLIVRQELAKRRVKATLYSDEDATVERVLESMESYACIHLACHASQNIENPLESAIYLHDGKIEISEIMKKDLPNADLAFLSACQTSAGDQNLPEEAVHLAAGMLTAGYRSVVATMWSISDKYAPEVADMFYKNLSDNETAEGVAGLDVIGSARALHTAIQALRSGLDDKKETDLLTWIPYVHYGI